MKKRLWVKEKHCMKLLVNGMLFGCVMLLGAGAFTVSSARSDIGDCMTAEGIDMKTAERVDITAAMTNCIDGPAAATIAHFDEMTVAVDAKMDQIIAAMDDRQETRDAIKACMDAADLDPLTTGIEEIQAVLTQCAADAGVDVESMAQTITDGIAAMELIKAEIEARIADIKYKQTDVRECVFTALDDLGPGDPGREAFKAILDDCMLVAGGDITLDVLSAQVRIVRDEKGMPYIYAESLADGITAQGFVTAQDRLSQLETARLMANGRYAEYGGEGYLQQDIFFRSLGFSRMGKAHAAMLDDESRQFVQWYVNGINAYISQMRDEYPVELAYLELDPNPWRVEDVLAFLYMIGFTSSGNYQSEILFSKLFNALGPADAMELAPVNIGPDSDFTLSSLLALPSGSAEPEGLLTYHNLPNEPMLDASTKVGSNNWVVGPALTRNNGAILAGDPHVSSNRLPNTWYPTAIITPEYRMVGTTIPGAPGFFSLRTNYITIGLTNSYLDCQDVYVETLDPQNPGNYLEGEASIPFDLISETFKVKDETQASGYKEIINPIMLSSRGPVISKTDQIATTLRWSAAETMTPSLCMFDILRARSVEDVKTALEKETILFFNRTFADAQGNIGWHTTGRIPIRTQNSGVYPQRVIDGSDNWIGWIPFEEMPHSYNPPQGWIGNANNRTMDENYPYYLTSQFASYYRFARMKELLDAVTDSTPEDHWRFQRDTKNILAEHIAPIFAEALIRFDDTRKIGRTLSHWDFHDDMRKTAPALFQMVMINAAYLTFKDELGEDLALEMLDDWYFWQVRFEQMIAAGESKWFDDKSTEDVETMQDIIHMAGQEAIAQFDDAPRWGEIHQIEFLNSLINDGPLKFLADGGTYPMSGSGETLYRSKYHFSEPFEAYYSASMRMVVDMSDNDKVMAVLAGGVSGRIFDRHYKDQMNAFMRGKKMYWWFSDKMIKAHAVSTLTLNCPR